MCDSNIPVTALMTLVNFQYTSYDIRFSPIVHCNIMIQQDTLGINYLMCFVAAIMMGSSYLCSYSSLASRCSQGNHWLQAI